MREILHVEGFVTNRDFKSENTSSIFPPATPRYPSCVTSHAESDVPFVHPKRDMGLLRYSRYKTLI